jgi:AAA domain/RepB DNA-primase from phage plasmid
LKGVGVENMDEFLSLIFRHSTDGQFYFANEINKKVGQAFPRWYRSKEDYASALTVNPTRITDLYFSPANYFRSTRPIKSNVAGASCVWVDCDSGLPKFEEAPAVLLESSPERYHAYWLLDQFRPAWWVEATCKSLALRYGTDTSGWDSTQLLRPPGSLNRKRGNYECKVIDLNDFTTEFPELEEPTVRNEVQSADSEMGLSAILARSHFSGRVLDLILKETETAKEGRSGLIFKTACELMQMGLSDEETEIVVAFQDRRLRKFIHHADAAGQIKNLVSKARQHVGVPPPVGSDHTKPLYKISKGGKEFLQENKDQEPFIIEDMLYEEGMIVLGGEPGAGKSRLAFQMLDCIACGKSFLGKKVTSPRKCAYISLDMNARRVRDIRKRQADEFTDKELELIDENVTLMIRGYGMDLTNTELQMRVQDDLINADVEVVFIDVLARAVPSMLDDKCAVAFLDWIQILMVNRRMSFVFVTHTRKGQVGSKGNTHLDDHYGSRHWSIPPDHAYTLAPYKGDKGLFVLKDRGGELPEVVKIHVDYGHSWYHLITDVQQEESKDKAHFAGDGKTEV